MQKNKKCPICECTGMRFILGISIIIIGILWLGNDIKLWQLNIPWLPLLLLFFGAVMVANELKKR